MHKKPFAYPLAKPVPSVYLLSSPGICAHALCHHVFIYIWVKWGIIVISCSLHMGMTLMSQLTSVGLKSYNLTIVVWVWSIDYLGIVTQWDLIWFDGTDHLSGRKSRQTFLVKVNQGCDCHSVHLLVCHPGSVGGWTDWEAFWIICNIAVGADMYKPRFFLEISSPKIWTFVFEFNIQQLSYYYFFSIFSN